MNETIGVKGGYQDRIRTIRIKKEILKKLQELNEEERKKLVNNIIKKKQINIKFVPIKLNNKKFIANEKENLENTLVNLRIEQIRIVDGIPKRDEITIEQIRIVDSIPKKEKKVEIVKEKEEETEPDELFPFEDNYKPNFKNIQNNKIIEEYQKKLKSIKKDLKSLIYEFTIIDNNHNNINTSNEAEELLNKLNTLIIKLDKLKSKYSIDAIDRYDENYIQVLIEDYIKEFKSRNFVKEVKNSDIYVLISEKLEELNHKKDELLDKINTKKNELLITEDELEKLKEKYNEFDKFNIKLLEYQNEQDKIIKEMNEKLENAETIEEKVEIRLKAMDKQTKKLLSILGVQLLLPIPNNIKRFVTSTALYMYYLKGMIKPELETKKYKIIKVEDYTNAINKNIESLEEIEKMIKKSSKEIDKIISNFKEEFKEYIPKLDSCKELLSNFEKIKYEIKDREEEIIDIKKKQIIELEKSKVKVKTKVDDLEIV